MNIDINSKNGILIEYTLTLKASRLKHFFMANISLQLCKEISNFTNLKIAKSIGISSKQYCEMESGERLMTRKQANVLKKLFHIKGDHIYMAALQLDAFLVSKAVIKIQKERINFLENQLKSKSKETATKSLDKKKAAKNPYR